MKKALSILAVIGFLLLGTFPLVAQEDNSTDTTEQSEEAMADSTMADSAAASEEAAPAEETTPATTEEEVEEERTFHQVLKEKFIEGDPSFMGVVLLALILGLAISIERIIYLNLATPNAKKLLNQIEDALQSGGVEKAKEVCRNTRGPVASIFYQGLERMDEGMKW
jgi:hypothetical protein